MVSQKLKDAVKTSIDMHYVVAKKAGLSQSSMSQLLRGIVEHQENDPRVIAIGKVVGVSPEDCFE